MRGAVCMHVCVCPADIINACIDFPCKSNGARGNATCHDIVGGPNSALGRTCNCTTRNAVYANDTSGCVGAHIYI
jgi:hypothetical protein